MMTAYHQKIENLAKEILNKGSMERDRNHQFSREVWNSCGALKIQGIAVPKEYGGLGFSTEESIKTLNRLGQYCTDGGLTFSISAHLLACAIPISLFGTEEQKKKYLPLLSNGEWIGANAMTEEAAGSDVFQMTTTAQKTSEGYVLNGSKTYVTNGSIADVFITYALTEKESGEQEVTAFILDQKAGVKSSAPIEKMGLCSCPMSSISFTDIVVPETAVLGKVGAGIPIFMQTMDWERLGISSSQLGIMRRIQTQNIHQVKSRKVDSNALKDFQAIAHKIAEIEIQLNAVEALIEKATQEVGKSRMVGKDIAIAKVFTSRAYQQITQESMQLFGAKGYLHSTEIERELRNAMAATIYSGTTEVLLNSIAKWSGL